MAATTEKPKAEEATQQPKKDYGKITTRVLQQITDLSNKGSLVIPRDYSPENALASAWFKLQEVQNKEKRPLYINGILQESVATMNSVANALTDMVVQGLNPAKDQCYFIVYGSTLTMQRSIYGDVALALRVKPNIDHYFSVIYQGDEVEVEKRRGRTYIASHKTKFENQNNPVAGAYVGSIDIESGEDLGCDLMTIEEIRTSWSKSPTYKYEKPGEGNHYLFEARYALRTVGRRHVMPIIRMSSDKQLLESVKRQDLETTTALVDEDAAVHANQGEILSIPAAAESVVTAPIQMPATEAVAEPVAVGAAQEDPGY